MKFTVSRWVKDEWKEIADVGFQTFTAEPITAAQAGASST
jgi:hypothetical protein